MKRLSFIIIILLSCLAINAQAQNQATPATTQTTTPTITSTQTPTPAATTIPTVTSTATPLPAPATTPMPTAKEPFGPFMFKAEDIIVILPINKGFRKATFPWQDGKITAEAKMKKDGTFVAKITFPRKTVEIFGEYDKKSEYVETYYSTHAAREALTGLDKNLSPEWITAKMLTSPETQTLEIEYQGALITQEGSKIQMLIVGEKGKVLANLTLISNEKVAELK